MYNVTVGIMARISYSYTTWTNMSCNFYVLDYYIS